MTQFRPLRQHRYSILTSEYFTKAEAQVLSKFRFNLPYIKLLRQDRAELVKEVRKLDLPRREALLTLHSRINTVYEINNWKDAYAMMRDYRERAIDRGEYTAPIKKKRKPIEKGNVVTQGKRYKERISARKRGAVSIQFDSEGRPVGEVYFNETSGRYEIR